MTAKDLILAVIGQIGTGGGIGHVIEYRGSAIRALSMEGRMTVCNMSIEAGARAGMIAPDDTTFAYLEGRAHAPQGAAWDDAVADWRTLRSDDGAAWDREVRIDASHAAAAGVVGDQPRPGHLDRRARSRRRTTSPTRRRESRSPGRSSTWRSRRARRCATSPSTRCSSARARTAGSRTCGRPPPCSTAARSRRSG